MSPLRLTIDEIVGALQSTSPTLTTTLGSAQTSIMVQPKPRHTLDHLPKYTGKREEWESWKLLTRNKIAVDGLAIRDQQAQFSYLFTSLDMQPRTRMYMWIQDIQQNCPNEATATGFLI